VELNQTLNSPPLSLFRNISKCNVSIRKTEVNGRLKKEELEKLIQKVLHQQVVEDFVISVNINESLPITTLHVPLFKTDPNAITDTSVSNPDAVVSHVRGESVARIRYQPTIEHQKKYVKHLWTKKDRLSGQLIVQYDVDRSANDGNEVQILVRARS
jgi:hypothetical protein